MISELFQKLFPGEPTIPQGCPWYEGQVKFGMPNINWCENTVCHIINEPANALTNFSYIFVGLALWYVQKKRNDVKLPYFVPAVLLVGFFSLIYHSTNNALTQFLDFIGMYLYTSLLIVYNLLRAGYISKAQRCWAYLAAIMINNVIFFVFPMIGIPVQLIIALDVGVILSLEYMAYKKSTSPINYKQLKIALALMAVAQMFSQLDMKRIMCDPDNHFLQGHALWHILSGISMWFAYHFYLQFSEKLKKE
ncbi:MAG: ceramidase domain-containing protein [Bacteriovoracaceae bacterium]|nr:ceramidase domain-containing protein [Bacteriovoracaceae bacterium]